MLLTYSNGEAPKVRLAVGQDLGRPQGVAPTACSRGQGLGQTKGLAPRHGRQDTWQTRGRHRAVTVCPYG